MTTNYEKYFGTPERAAMTVVDILNEVVQRANEIFKAVDTPYCARNSLTSVELLDLLQREAKDGQVPRVSS